MVRWNGAAFPYTLVPIGMAASLLPETPGNYVFCRLEANGGYSPIYAGEADNLKARFKNHHKERCIAQNGVTHISYRYNNNPADRIFEETSIMFSNLLPCNG